MERLRLKLRTEVEGLELVLFRTIPGDVLPGGKYCLQFVLNGVPVVVTVIDANDISREVKGSLIEDLFRLKDRPGQNFFDHVLDLVKKSEEASHRTS